ncbi:hypothetical protein BDZ90DRAFT_156541 [Jaminaea rosea]|uniref:Uncharacterized protein n=1 Tax=Jaminaea rosea TaxID=1569628 RepID=A0A316UXP6_9BASI|nr:hypothetical protein BDZ90DRAFT_156541 [Jaminaea rosea]PWN27915.1 hypothetical protein BDZ90DRAFT_156541 [Jaminaea rosea]
MSGVWYHFALGGRQHRVRLSDEHLFGQARQCSQTTLISEPQRVPSPPPEASITLPPAPTEHGARPVQHQASQSQLKTEPQPTSSSAALEQPCDELHFRTSNQGQSSVPSSGQESEVHEDAVEGKELDYDHNNLNHGQGTGRSHPQENAGSAGATVATENSSLAHWETFSFPSWIPQAKEGDIGWRLFEGYPCTVIDSDVHLKFGQWPFRFPAYGKKIANGSAKLFLRDIEWDPEVAVQPHACSPVASWILNHCHIVFASEAHPTQWQPYRPCTKTLNEVEDRFFHLIAEATGLIGGLENIWDIKQPIAHCNKDVAISASLKGLAVRLADGGARFALESTNNDSIKTLILPGTQSDRTLLGRVPSRTILPDKQRLNMASYGSPQHLLLKVQRNAQAAPASRSAAVIRELAMSVTA